MKSQIKLQEFYILRSENCRFSFIIEKEKRKENCYYGKNLCRLFHILAQFPFTTSKSELDYYHQKVNVRVGLRVAEQRKTYDLKKQGYFKEIPEMLGIEGKVFSQSPKNFDSCATKLQKISCKTFHRKIYVF